MKFYQFTCSNGDVYEVPLYEIIFNKAKYAFDNHWFEDDASKSMIIEFGNVIEEITKEFNNDAGLIEDWAKNDMEWEDVACKARIVRVGEVLDMKKEWNNCVNIKIVEHERQ